MDPHVIDLAFLGGELEAVDVAGLGNRSIPRERDTGPLLHHYTNRPITDRGRCNCEPSRSPACEGFGQHHRQQRTGRQPAAETESCSSSEDLEHQPIVPGCMMKRWWSFLTQVLRNSWGSRPRFSPLPFL